MIYLIAVLCLTSLSTVCQVIQNDTARISLDEVVISATRIPVNTRQFTRITRIISKVEIAASPVRDLADLLEYIPDIDVRQRGPAGIQADISMRGGTFDQFAVLINGINFNDPQTGHFQMDIPLPLSCIERVEILSGSDVKSLGANAFTGAINIVTRVPAGKRVQAELYGGQYGYLETGANAENHSGHWWQQAGFNYQKSNGYRANTDFQKLNGFFQSGYNHSNINLSLMAGGLKKTFGANSFYSAKYPDQFEKTGSCFAAFQADKSGKINIRQSLYYRLHSDEFSLFRENPPEWYISPNYHLTQIAGSKTDAWFSSALGKTAFGLELRHESVWSTVLGEISPVAKAVYGISGIEYTRFGSRNHLSLSVEQQMETGRFKWSGGAVLHAVRSVKTYLQIYPGLDISYRLNPSIRTYLSFNRAFRLPTFTELYYQSPTNLGNPSLLPETAWHTEFGTEFRKNGLSAKLIGFYRDATQSIDWVRAGNETVWHSENLGHVRTWGIETGVSYVPETRQGLGKVTERIDLGLRRYFQHHSVENLYSQYLLDYLKWKLTTSLTLRAGTAMRFSVSLNWQERNGSYTGMDSEGNMKEIDYKPFSLVDIKISYRLKWVSLMAECTNLLNRQYFDLSSIPQPGAWLKAGVEINLVGKH